MIESGCGEISSIVDNRPDSSCLKINTVCAELIAGFVRAEDKFLGTTVILIYGINPVVILILSD
jgi:hypothetical protein